MTQHPIKKRRSRREAMAFFFSTDMADISTGISQSPAKFPFSPQRTGIIAQPGKASDCPRDGHGRCTVKPTSIRFTAPQQEGKPHERLRKRL
jgi:hypothetical protein